VQGRLSGPSNNAGGTVEEFLEPDESLGLAD